MRSYYQRDKDYKFEQQMNKMLEEYEDTIWEKIGEIIWNICIFSFVTYFFGYWILYVTVLPALWDARYIILILSGSLGCLFYSALRNARQVNPEL